MYCQFKDGYHMEKPLISIIVSAYKVQDYLEQCLLSLIKQTYTNIEIILVLGKGDEQCNRICLKFQEIDTRITILEEEPMGLSAARNSGIEKANGKYIGFIDGDDWIELDMYENLINLIIEYQADVAVCGFFVEYNEDAQNKCSIEKNKIKKMNSLEAIQSIFYQRDILTSAWDKLYKRELFNEIRYPNKSSLEDLATTYRIFEKANSIIVTKKKGYHYRVRSSSLLNTYNIKNQKDIDRIMDEIDVFTNEKYPGLKSAVNNIYVRSYFADLRHNLECESNFKYALKAVKKIRSRAIYVILDKNSKKIAKCVAIVGSMGVVPSKILLKLFDHRRERAYP